MVNITKLYCGEEQPADGLRYGHGHGAPNRPPNAGPIVVWNVTRTCNLRCVHCYSDSYAQKYPGELTHDEAKRVIDDLAAFQVPARAVFRRRTTDAARSVGTDEAMPPARACASRCRRTAR